MDEIQQQPCGAVGPKLGGAQAPALVTKRPQNVSLVPLRRAACMARTGSIVALRTRYDGSAGSDGWGLTSGGDRKAAQEGPKPSPEHFPGTFPDGFMNAEDVAFSSRSALAGLPFPGRHEFDSQKVG